MQQEGATLISADGDEISAARQRVCCLSGRGRGWWSVCFLFPLQLRQLGHTNSKSLSPRTSTIQKKKSLPLCREAFATAQRYDETLQAVRRFLQNTAGHLISTSRNVFVGTNGARLSISSRPMSNNSSPERSARGTFNRVFAAL